MRTSLEIGDVSKAVAARDRINALTEEHWGSLARGEGPNERDRYLAMIERRGLEGFAYHSMEVLRSGPVLEMINRLAVLKAKFP